MDIYHALPIRILIAMTFVVASQVQAQESQEPPALTKVMPRTQGAARQWRIIGADCSYQVLRHQRDESGRLGQPAERMVIHTGAGTYLYAERPVEEARVLDDLEVGVWIRSAQPGVQLYGRVVFPDAIDPETGEPATVLVPGERYTGAGQWQRLSLRGLEQEMQRRLRVLRFELKQPIQDRGAYLRSLVLNTFAGPGIAELWIGQVEQQGVIPPPAAVQNPIKPVAFTSETLDPEDLPHRRVSRLIVEGRPFFPRVIEYQGESFELLRQLGFNTVALSQWPDAGQQLQAQQHDLWMICPPPESDTDEVLDAKRILAWHCGEDYQLQKHPPGHLRDVRLSDPLARPLLAGFQQDQWMLSREVDVVLRTRRPLGSSFELSHYGSWLFQMSHLVRPGTPFWASVQTELSQEVVAQVAGLLGDVGAVPRNVQVEQVRQMALAAVASGARGLWFHSTTPLNEATPAGELRRLMLELVNYELGLIEPWAMGGHRIGTVDGQNAELRVVALATERSRLLIPTYVQPFAQFACRPAAGGNTLIIPGVPDSTDAFLLNPLGLTPISRQRISGGLQIHLTADNADSLLLLTEDPLVATHVNRTVAAHRQRVVDLEQELADQLLHEFETKASRTMLGKAERVKAWEAARSSLSQSRQLSNARDLNSAYLFGQRARRELNRLQADVWRDAVAKWPTPLLQPTGAAFGLVTIPTNVTADLALTRRWGPNRLRGGDCENLSYMVDAGWRQFRTSPDDVITYLALSPHQPHSGEHCLRMLVSPQTREADRSIVEFAPVWVHSAPITVEPGQQVRITGWIRIDYPIRGSLDGCLVSDSLSGSDLAVRFDRTDGWEPFELIRAVTRHDHLTVTFALHGLGEVKIDDVQVTISEP
jgi:hypothetical protein